MVEMETGKGGSMPKSTKGWSWGQYQIDEEHLSFNVDGKQCFIVPYEDIALLPSGTEKDELSLEFKQDDTKDKSDILCEMRFYVPNNNEE